ncbi:hypothetical protein LEP1GSC055_3571 [Leptospira borgpetersenii str. Brem 307]|nr:hypothetical protein LEP1GSC055_3571 [Leptospira borgpetersenii str. Brem 307]
MLTKAGLRSSYCETPESDSIFIKTRRAPIEARRFSYQFDFSDKAELKTCPKT